MRSPVFGSFNDVVAVWFSSPLRTPLQFIAGSFPFKWLSNIVFEPSSADKTLGRKPLCDLFLFECGHGWAPVSSSRQLSPTYKSCDVRAKRLMCFTSCEGHHTVPAPITVSLRHLSELYMLNKEVTLKAVNLITNQLPFHQPWFLKATYKL